MNTQGVGLDTQQLYLREILFVDLTEHAWSKYILILPCLSKFANIDRKSRRGKSILK